MAKGTPKRDGSGKGTQSNRNVGGCRTGGPGHGNGNRRGNGSGRKK